MVNLSVRVGAAEGDVYVAGGTLDSIGGVVYVDTADDSLISQQAAKQAEVDSWIVAVISLGTGSICGAILGKEAFRSA